MLKRVLFGLPLMTALIITATPAVVFSDEAACVQGQKWVESHRNSLPETYDEYLASPTQYHLAIYGALPAGIKAALWTEHIQRYRDAHPELTPAQLALIKEALDLISKPDTFMARTRQQKKIDFTFQKSVELGNHAELLFGREEAAALLFHLDGAPEERLGHEKNPVKTLLRECDCAFTGGGCWFDEYCRVGNCQTPVTGCGILGLFDCDGRCKISGTV